MKNLETPGKTGRVGRYAFGFVHEVMIKNMDISTLCIEESIAKCLPSYSASCLLFKTESFRVCIKPQVDCSPQAYNLFSALGSATKLTMNLTCG